MKHLVIFLFCPFYLFSQDYTLEDIGDNYLFHHFSPVYTYSDAQNIVLRRNNGSVGLIKVYDSVANQSYLFRFYETNTLSLTITNLKFTIKEEGDSYNYCTEGSVSTYYPNGKLRSEYELDSNGSIKNSVLFYTLEGDCLNEIDTKGNEMYSGVFIQKWAAGDYVKLLSKGKCKFELFYSNGSWFKVNSDGLGEQIRETIRLKRIRKRYYLGESYCLYFPNL